MSKNPKTPVDEKQDGAEKFAIEESMIEPWERQPGESARAYEAFSIYRDMGPNRSAAKACDLVGKGIGTLKRWAMEFKWASRADAWDREVEKRKIQIQFETIEKMRGRHAALGERMVELAGKAVEELMEKPWKVSGNALAQLAVEGVKIERLSRGDSGEVIEERDGGKTTFDPVQFYIPDNGRGNEDNE